MIDRVDVLLTEFNYQFNARLHAVYLGKRPKSRKIMVNGSPKTGTTWMLNLITSVPGYYNKGNFHGDITAYRHLFPGDVIHSHDTWSPELQHILEEGDFRTICMVRDPRDQLISRVFHIKRDHTHQWNAELNKISLDEAIHLCIEGQPGLPSTQRMIQKTLSWFRGLDSVMIVHYEDLLADTFGQFNRVLDHCELELPPKFIWSIIKRNSFKNLTIGRRFWKKPRKPGQEDPHSHFRKGITGDWKKYLNEGHVTAFNKAAGDLLVELGYELGVD